LFVVGKTTTHAYRYRQGLRDVDMHAPSLFDAKFWEVIGEGKEGRSSHLFSFSFFLLLVLRHWLRHF
jgi:hypothetical protein